MINKLDFLSIFTATTIHLNTDPPGYPVNVYDPTIEDRVDTSRNRMEQVGVWPTFPYEGGMSIHIEGDIIGTDSADYNTRRFALCAAFRSAGIRTDRKHGTLTVGYDGQTEDWKTDVSVMAFSAPRGGLSPAISHFAVTLFSFTPYFIGVTSGDFHYDA